MELLSRGIEPWARELLQASPVVVVEGARQVGKSTLVSMLDGPATSFSTMDDDLSRAFAHDDPQGFLAQAGAGRLVIDEVQRCPEIVLPLKAEVDRDRRPGRFVLTGSANLLRLPGAQDSLAGRAMTLRLHPFSQSELVGQPGDWVSAVLAAVGPGGPLPQATADRADIVARLVQGGYPVVQGMAPRLRTAWLRDYANRLVERDVADIGTVQPALLRRLLNLVAAAPGRELVLEHLAEDLGTSRATVARYLDLLEALFLVQRLPAWSRNLTSRQVQRPKCYLTDPGLAAALSGQSEQHLVTLQGSDHLGSLLENFVVCELVRQQGWSTAGYELSHYRDRNGAEVDIVVETPGGVVGIEVKSAMAARQDHFRHLVGLRDRLKGEFLAGVVLTTGTGQRAGDRLLSLPISSLWSW